MLKDCCQVERNLIEYTNGTVEYYAQGQGTLVVLLPSLIRGAEDFAEISCYLSAQGLRVLRPQPRGIGKTQYQGPKKIEEITLHDLAADVIAVLEQEKGGPALVGGHAYGNWIARMVAVERPDLVWAVAIIAAAAKGSIPPHLNESINRSSNMALEASQRLQCLSHVFFAEGHDPSPWLEGWHHSADAIQRSASRNTPQDSFWHAGGVPLLEIRAMNDPLSPIERQHELEKLFPARTTHVEIANASHALLPEQPEALAAVIATYIKTLQARR